VAHATGPGDPGNIDEAICIGVLPIAEDVKPTNLASQPFTTITFSATGAAADRPPADPFAVPSQPLVSSIRSLASFSFRPLTLLSRLNIRFEFLQPRSPQRRLEPRPKHSVRQMLQAEHQLQPQRSEKGVGRDT
jgi:hypothetical protein